MQVSIFRGRSLLAGLSASSLSLGATLVIQVLTVPIFIAAVGAEEYGRWLVLTAIPIYLSYADLGFAGASATVATYCIGRADFAGANRVLSAAWLFVTLACIGLGVVGASIWFVGDVAGAWETSSDSVAIVAILILWTGLWMQAGFAEAAMRAAGNYAAGISYLTVARLVEFGVLVLSVIISRNLLLTAAAVLVARVALVLAIFARVRNQLEWFRLSPRAASLGEIRRLVGPSITYAGFGMGTALVNQGMVLAVASRLGPVAVVAYSTVRTLVNVIMQLNNVLTNGSLADLTVSQARGDFERTRRIARTISLSMLAITLVAGILVSVLGPLTVSLWTGGSVVVGFAFVMLMVGTTVADTPWQAIVNVLRASNDHQAAGVAFLISCAIAVCVAWIALPRFGLVAAPLALFIVDLVVIPVSIFSVRRVWRRWEVLTNEFDLD